MKGAGSEGDGVGAGESEGAVERKLNSETSSTETTADSQDINSLLEFQCEFGLAGGLRCDKVCIAETGVALLKTTMGKFALAWDIKES
jgi:hypothetical protein